MITAVDDAGKPAGLDQAGLGLLAAIAVIAIPSDPTKVPGITPTTHPGTSTTAAALAGQAAGNPFTAVPSTSAALISAVAAGGPTGGVTLAVRST